MGNTKLVPSFKEEFVWLSRLFGATRLWREFGTSVGILSDMRGGRAATLINGGGGKGVNLQTNI